MSVCLSQTLISFRAECRRREERREKFSHENCTLQTIHLGPAGRRPAWAYDDDDDDDDVGKEEVEEEQKDAIGNLI